MFMATKTITITEDAYERLNALKEDYESFSEAIRRLTSKVRLSDFAGILSNKEAKNLKERIKITREQSRKRMEEIRKKLR